MKSPISIALLTIFIQSSLAFEPTEEGVYAVFDTSLGEFTVKLAYDAVPLTTANFVGLAEGRIPQFSAETGEPVAIGPYYDGMIFHRVVDNFVVQAGDPDPDDDLVNGPGYRIPDEMNPSLTHNIPYVIAMANNYCFSCEESGQFFGIGENTGGSQFYITVEPSASSAGPGYLDGHFTIFGVVEDGFQVVEAISEVQVNADGRPLVDVVINTVTIVREGEEANAWDISAYELPVATSGLEKVSFSADPGAPGFRIATEAGESLLIQKSNDLQTWTQEFLDIDEPGQIDIAMENRERLFLQLSALRDPTVYAESVPGASFAFDIFNHPFHALQTRTWSFSFDSDPGGANSPNGFGSVSVNLSGFPSAVILGYEYHRLPDGARLRVVTESRQVMTFYMRFTSENGGGYLAWIDDYFHGTPIPQSTLVTPQRFPVTGTFTFSKP